MSTAPWPGPAMTNPARPGVIAATTTPFTSDLRVDIEGWRSALHATAGQVDAVLVAGTTGEFPSLTHGERVKLIEAAVDVLGPERVIAHVGAADAREASALARHAVEAGAHRLTALSPYYLPATFAEVVAYYDQVCAAVDVTVYAYVFPERTSVAITPEQYAELIRCTPVAGVKLSGAPSAHIAEYVAASGGRPVFSGNDADLAAVGAQGGAGIISGCAAALPGPFRELADSLAAVGAGDDALVRRVVALLGLSIGRIKYVQSLLGWQGPWARMAVGMPTDPDLRRQLAALAAEVGPSRA
jgi:4-hydroxy-tetrahydrodipicolinate synthase